MYMRVWIRQEKNEISNCESKKFKNPKARPMIEK